MNSLRLFSAKFVYIVLAYFLSFAQLEAADSSVVICHNVTRLISIEHAKEVSSLNAEIVNLKRPKNFQEWDQSIVRIQEKSQALAQRLSEEELSAIAHNFLDDLRRPNGYLPGLTPDWNANSIAELKEDVLLNLKLKTSSSKLDNVIGNINQFEMLRELIELKILGGQDITNISNNRIEVSLPRLWQTAVLLELKKRWSVSI